MTKRETATVLAALRHWQESVQIGVYDDYNVPAASFFARFAGFFNEDDSRPLSSHEIDELYAQLKKEAKL